MKSELSTKEAALEQATHQAQSLSDSLRIQKAQLDAVQTELQKAREAASSSSRQALENMMASQEGSSGAQDLQNLLRNTQRQLEKMKTELSEKEQKMVLLEAEKATSGRRLKEALATIQQLRTAASREPSFSSDPQLLYDTVRQTRQRTTLPLYAKLSPNVTDIRVSCRAAEDAGADALTLSNTFRAMTIDIQKRRPYLGNLSGGMSGPAVKPMNMFLVWQAYETVHIPIIACGGIASWRDAVEYLMAGASAVQVGSCNFNDPMTMHNIIHDLDSYLHRNGIASVRELCGAAHKQ